MPLRVICAVLVLSWTGAGGFAQSSSTTPPQSPDDHEVNSKFHRLRALPAEWLVGPYVRGTDPLQPLTVKQRSSIYARQTFLNTAAYAARLFSSGIDQARGDPRQWGGGWAGYGRRFGSRYGQFVIASTLQAAGNGVMGYEPRYDLCRCKGFWPRTEHAFLRSFVTYNRTETTLRPQFPLFAGSLGAGMLSSVWLPGHRGAWTEGGRSILWQVGIGAGVNWVSEFALDVLHKADRKKYPLPGNDSPSLPDRR